MVLRTILGILLGLALVASVFGESPSEQPPTFEQKQKFGPGGLRDRIKDRISENNHLIKKMGPKPFLIAGDPRFEQMSKLIFLSESEIEEAIQNWAPQHHLDGQQKQMMKTMILRMRERFYREADRLEKKLGLNLEGEQKEAFMKRLLESRISVEREIRQAAEMELEKRQDEIESSLKAEFQGQ
ncbi:MAG: hypothetical protein AAFY98_02690 [Verrucomicrobiota bacterium]